MRLPKPPNYKKDAKITTRGWRHPRTNELLVPKKFTQEEINAYNASLNGPDPIIIQAPAEETAPVVETVAVFEGQEIVEEVEQPDETPDFETMTKAQLEMWARENIGIELDRRLVKADLITQIRENL